MTDPLPDGVLAESVARVWLRLRPVAIERLRHVAGALQSTAASGLARKDREAAASDAHKLAGTLGIYGFDDGTAMARRAESLLCPSGPPSVAGNGRAEADRLAGDLLSLADRLERAG